MPELDFENLSQTELAQLVGIDRTTVRSWTQRGMPYRKPTGKGQPASYSSAICIHWRAGHKFSEQPTMASLELSPLQKTAIGWLAGNAAHISAEDEKLFVGMMAGAGLKREQALRHLEYARGILRR
jgi:phage terminase Nu1 subunit (DNA packaging protein)